MKMSVRAIIAASVANGRNDQERKKDVMDLARDAGLITSKVTCGTCVRPMKESPTSKTKDGFRWRCTGECKGERTIKYESFFRDANVTVPEWLRFIIEWSSPVAKFNIGSDRRENREGNAEINS